MTSTEPTKPKRSGPERGWSLKLWDAYVDVGESDAGYVESCNRFLEVMIEHHLHDTLELVRDLMHLFVLKEEAPNPERYMYGIPSIALAEMRKANLQDELDVYRRWYSKNIKWPGKCSCEREEVELDRMLGLLSPWEDDGPLKRIWRTQPMFLSACVQVARRSLREDGFDHLELYTSRGKHEVDEPIPEDEWIDTPLIIKASRRMEAYFLSGDWRIDDAPMEDLKDVSGIGFSVERHPKESRKDYINRVKGQLDDRLIRAMEKSTEIALHPKVKLRSGPALDLSNRHEEMLVLRLFGATRPEIIQAMPDAFLKEDGEPVKNKLNAVSKHTERIARRLGFLAASGETS
jgi:hypothetical protein